MKIRLLHFAVLRDLCGTGEESCELPEGSTCGQLWEELGARHPQLRAFKSLPLTAVNQEYASASAELHDGDEVAFIPPVAGG